MKKMNILEEAEEAVDAEEEMQLATVSSFDDLPSDEGSDEHIFYQLGKGNRTTLIDRYDDENDW
jgi:hypothetical protein